MRTLMKLLILSVFLVGVHGCTTHGTPIIQLGSVRFVAQSQPDSVSEAGIGQDPQSGGMFLQWYGTEGASGYKLYRSDSTDMNGVPLAFLPVATITHSTSVNDTSYIDPTAQVGIRYYYYVLAFASDGSQSKSSDTINYKLLVRPSPNYPGLNASLDSVSYFGWNDNSGGGYTVIRVEDVSIVPQTYLWVSTRFQMYDANPTKAFNFDGKAAGKLISGHTYHWRVDRFNLNGEGLPFEGARSVWQTFSIK